MQLQETLPMHDLHPSTPPRAEDLRRATLREAAGSSPEMGRLPLPLPSSEFLVLFALGADTVAILAAVFFATSSDRHIDVRSSLYEILLGPFSAPILMGTLLYLVIFGVLGAYDRQHFFSSSRNLYLVFKASYTWLIIFLALCLALKLEPTISRYFFFWAFLNSWVFLSAWRLVFCQLLIETKWNLAFREQVLVIGWSKESNILFDKILRDAGHFYEVIGCTPSPYGKFWVTPPSQVPVLGDYNSLPELIRERRPSIVIMADLDPVMGEIIALANLCIRESVQFKVIPSYFQTLSSGLHLEHVSGVPVLGVSKLPLDHVFNRIIKRAVDVVGGIVGLVISIPIIFFFGILIRRESPGPVIYSQPRSGMGGREFRIFKLRSMKLDADAYGLVRTSKDDPRRLKIGVFMRKFNIDELPQFWNVLVGDMSLVGPRPERSEDVATLKDEITHYNARHFSKPGLTGYAQVNGLRGNTDLTARLRYDLYYLENWSIFLDFYIMARTFLNQKNAN
jgi:exopolysaccharide biosynthesis polyprenyl glycosylphosphotransferase